MLKSLLCSVAQCCTVAPLLCVWQAGEIMPRYTYLAQMALAFSARKLLLRLEMAPSSKMRSIDYLSLGWGLPPLLQCNRYSYFWQGPVWGGGGGAACRRDHEVEGRPQLAFYQLKKPHWWDYLFHLAVKHTANQRASQHSLSWRTTKILSLEGG